MNTDPDTQAAYDAYRAAYADERRAWWARYAAELAVYQRRGVPYEDGTQSTRQKRRHIRKQLDAIQDQEHQLALYARQEASQ